MQHLPQGVKDEEGCFVYQCTTPGGIGTRTIPSVATEDKSGEFVLELSEMVSVDLVRHSREPDSTNGPFLRLSDASGWVFERKYGEQVMRRVHVEKGQLWTFYVGNFPYGLALRRHPIDRQDVVINGITYRPMQKIVCDRKVRHPDSGINFYRVQGTDGWVFDKRLDEITEYKPMLYQEDMVKEESKVYECLGAIAIRVKPTIGDSFRTDLNILSGQLVAIDVSLYPSDSDRSGPFLRLTDGSGWVFTHKEYQTLMRPVMLHKGRWTLRVENAPAGIALRSQPIDSLKFRETTGTVYAPGAHVECTHMVQTSSGVSFYRVAGTDGWIFDRRDGETVATLLYEDRSPHVATFSSTTASAWSLDFIRGIAAAVPGVQEMSLNESSRVISFKNAESDTRINVYYTTRTVGTALTHPSQGKTQLFRRNCTTEELVKIFHDPRVHTGRGYKRKHHASQHTEEPDRVVSLTQYGQGILADQEAEARNLIVDLDEDIDRLKEQKRTLLVKVRDADLERSRAAEKTVAKCKQRMQEFRERVAEQARLKQQQEARRLEEERRQQLRQQQEQALREATCDDCGKVFLNSQAKWQHWNAVHRISCSYCQREFNDYRALDQHKDALGHW
jgi:hypothetical protein